jgi:CDGSH iron-sulfur domain-containing protein 3
LAEVEIKVRDDGPYKVTGPVRLIDAQGHVFEIEGDRPIALCRCGQSRTKPFCDASHKESGFRSCPRAVVAQAG